MSKKAHNIANALVGAVNRKQHSKDVVPSFEEAKDPASELPSMDDSPSGDELSLESELDSDSPDLQALSAMESKIKELYAHVKGLRGMKKPSSKPPGETL